MLLTELAATARPKLSEEREEFRRLYQAERFTEARRLAEKGYEAGRERVAWVHNLASVAMEQGNLREAYSLYLTHAPLASEPTDFYSAANFNLSFGLVCKRLYVLHGTEDYFDRASIAYTAAAEMFVEARERACTAYAENCYANLLIVADRASDAFKHVDAAQLLFNDVGEFARAADCEDTRALAHEALGNYVDAFECASRAVVTLRRCGAAEAKSIWQAEETCDRVYEKMKATSV